MQRNGKPLMLTELKRLRFQRLADASVDGYVTAKETFDLDDEENEDEDRNNQVDGQAIADRMRDEQIRARLTEAGIEEEKASLEEKSPSHHSHKKPPTCGASAYESCFDSIDGRLDEDIYSYSESESAQTEVFENPPEAEETAITVYENVGEAENRKLEHVELPDQGKKEETEESEEEEPLEMEPTQTISVTSLDDLENENAVISSGSGSGQKFGGNGDSNDTDGMRSPSNWRHDWDSRPVAALPTPVRMNAVSPQVFESIFDDKGRVKKDKPVKKYLEQKRFSLASIHDVANH
ncbi:hypothetical protein WR25_19327 isoform B [Diploscapter pachys]|uniref:Uncharacterized protein n=1 Tax=Diploscapter pachys TaxID=2018661 RepID=A0A2A2JUP0_9BILA|nr:hypothetical protein WR25_19327 isoform A [Diploscapter pachys]PAV65415.1 hypothetical protein WR25_19327 isoform B [Diploscapter pachys]